MGDFLFCSFLSIPAFNDCALYYFFKKNKKKQCTVKIEKMACIKLSTDHSAHIHSVLAPSLLRVTQFTGTHFICSLFLFLSLCLCFSSLFSLHLPTLSSLPCSHLSPLSCISHRSTQSCHPSASFWPSSKPKHKARWLLPWLCVFHSQTGSLSVRPQSLPFSSQSLDSHPSS